jgi:hypothetical protein
VAEHEGFNSTKSSTIFFYYYFFLFLFLFSSKEFDN